jgi:hypothetical protein
MSDVVRTFVDHSRIRRIAQSSNSKQLPKQKAALTARPFLFDAVLSGAK